MAAHARIPLIVVGLGVAGSALSLWLLHPGKPPSFTRIKDDASASDAQSDTQSDTPSPSAYPVRTTPPQPGVTDTMSLGGGLKVDLFSADRYWNVLDQDSLILKKRGHEIGRVRCIDLYNQWKRDGAMSHKVANDTYWELSQRSNLGFALQHLPQASRLAVITLFNLGASDTYHTWYGSYLVRFDTRPHFSVTPLREITRDDPSANDDRPCLAVHHKAVYFAIGLTMVQTTPEGAFVGRPVVNPQAAHW